MELLSLIFVVYLFKVLILLLSFLCFCIFWTNLQHQVVWIFPIPYWNIFLNKKKLKMFNRENESKKKTKNYIFSILKYRKDTYAQNEIYIHMHSFSYKGVLPYHCKVAIQHVVSEYNRTWLWNTFMLLEKHRDSKYSHISGLYSSNL